MDHEEAVERAVRSGKQIGPPPADIITTSSPHNSAHALTYLGGMLDAEFKPINGWRDLSGPSKDAGSDA